MSGSKLQQEIARKETDMEKTVDKVMKKPELLSEVFEGLGSGKARIKYGCVKVLRLISEKKPEILYPRMDFFSDLLDSDNKFLKWGAIHTIANLTAADSERRFEGIFDKYFAPIPGPELIPAGNVIGGAAKIALAKPELSDRIAKEILKVEKATYQTAECRNVAMGHAIKSFDLFFDQIKDKEPVINLIKKQLKNTRNATRKKAEKFLKKWID
jgi:hypothetical protein